MNTVYFIDDDITTCFLMETKLSTSNFTIKTYNCSQTFLNTESELNESLIFLDVNMPSPDGFETAQELIKRNVDRSKIHILTDDKEVEMRFKNALAITHFIAKIDLDVNYLEALEQ